MQEHKQISETVEETPEDFRMESEDYTIQDLVRGGYGVGQVEGKYLGTFKTYSEAQLAIREKMSRENFYPNVWFISDHGNADLVQLTA